MFDYYCCINIDKHYTNRGGVFPVHRNNLGWHAHICDITKREANHSSICQPCACILHKCQCGNLKLPDRKGGQGESSRSGGKARLWKTAVNMSDCAVLGCKPEPGASIHYLPRNPALKQAWMDFIYRHRLSRPSNTVGIRVCGAHFSKDCFVNFFQRSMGFAKKLILKPDAVPSIYPGNPTWLKHGSISFTGRSLQRNAFLRAAHCQTEVGGFSKC